MARATARLVQTLIQEDPIKFEGFRDSKIDWPLLPRLDTAPVTRSSAQKKLLQPSHFLNRVLAEVHHDVEATSSDQLAYLALLDRVLEDRTIDAKEEGMLVDAALQWDLDVKQICTAHRQYIDNLAVHALADGVITAAERSDLYRVAQLLGYDQAELDACLEGAAKQLKTVGKVALSTTAPNDLQGKTVCFTGELQSTINGQPITRDIAETLAQKAGLVIANSVTKKTDLLVVADANTQSGKAKKAHQYGIRILAETVFWRMIGVNVQ